MKACSECGEATDLHIDIINMLGDTADRMWLCRAHIEEAKQILSDAAPGTPVQDTTLD